MTQPTGPAATAAPAETTTPATGQTFTQADLDRIVSERLGRQRAQYADYDDLKAKAAKHDEAVEAQKTEAQKAIDRAAAAEARAAKAELESLRTAVAAEKGLPATAAKRLQGSNRAELEADAAEMLKEMVGGKPTTGQPGRPVEALKSGALPASGTSTVDMDAWMRGKARK